MNRAGAAGPDCHPGGAGLHCGRGNSLSNGPTPGRDMSDRPPLKYVLRGDDADPQAPLGGKARALAALRDAGLSIPPWFVLTPAACTASQNGDALRPTPAVAAELAQAVRELCPDGA